MVQYLDLIKHILKNGIETENRTGVNTLSVFGYQMRFNLQDGFPAVTTKKIAWKSVVGELLWFLEGSTDERRLAELTHGLNRESLVNMKTIWTENADNQGVKLGYKNNPYEKQLGPIYGYQWRNFGGSDPTSIDKRYAGDGTDQIAFILNEIKKNPESRRLILTAWNPLAIHKMSLPPCHLLCQFRVIHNELNCMLTIRSNDIGLGAPFNIASYALLTHIIARECNLDVGELVYSIGDAHIYLDHVDALKIQLERQPFPLPSLKIDPDFNLSKYLYRAFPVDTASQFSLENYKFHPSLKMSMAV